MKKAIAFLFALIVSTVVIPQKSAILLDHYKNEYRTFKEFIKYSSLIKGDTNIDVKFYHLNIEIAIDSHYVAGNVLCRFEPVVPSLNTVSLNLNSALTVDNIGAPATSFYQDNDLVVITLDDYYNPGDLIDLSIDYHGVPVLAGGYKGLRYETHGSGEPIIATLSTPYLAHYWYPCKDGPQDKPDSVYVDITIQDESINGQPLIAVSNGLLENVIDNGDTKTFQWRHRYPIVPYYVMAAVSNYVHFQNQFNGNSGESFPLDYYVFNEDLNSSISGVEGLGDVIEFYSGVFGPYPFSDEKYGMTQLGFYGAIENQTNTIQNNLSSSWFSTSVHELAHMWFGDMITCANWHHGWLNEGFATYAEALWAEHLYGFIGYKNNMATNEFWNGGTLYLQNAQDTFNIFQPIIYSKGAYTLHMLRGVVGDDDFFTAFLQYAQDPDFKYKNASTEDLQQVFENVSGIDLGFFFDQWVYDEYYPIYYFNFGQNANNELHLVIHQAQEELYDYRPVFEMPVRIKFNFTSGGDTTVTVWNDEQTQYFSFVLNEEVESVEFDPDKWILRKVEYHPEIPVGIDEAIADEMIRVFPNPSTGKVGFEFPGLSNNQVEISIYDLNGRIVKKLNGGKSSDSGLTWDGSDQLGKSVGSGSYFAEITEGGNVFRKKIILVK